jgi:hypothetical protein
MNPSKDTRMPRPKQAHSNNADRWIALSLESVKDQKN